MTLLDETVGAEAAPFYIGIFQIFLVLGPALGNVVGGRFLETYVDFERSESPDCGSGDPSWIGAWWLGFIIGGFLTWACAMFMCCYPSKIPKTKLSKTKVAPQGDSQVPVMRRSDFARTRLTMSISRLSTASSIVRVFEKDRMFNFTEIVNKVLQLLKNPTYILLCIGGGLDGIVISGLVFFLPKFLEKQFGGTPSDASILMGMVVVPAGGLGTFFGGYLVKKFHLTREQVLRMYIYCQLITIPCSLGFMSHCSNVPFAGISSRYNNSHHITAIEDFSLTSTCNLECSYKNGNLCGGKDQDVYQPVCGSDKKLYFNPCYAGCKNQVNLEYDSNIENNMCKAQRNYTECSCVAKIEDISTPFASDDMDQCTNECSLEKAVFMICLFVTIWFTCMSAMPCVACILRFVEPENKSMSMGIANIIVR